MILCLYTESFNSFKKLLELGANPNFKDPFTSYSALIYACKLFGSLSIDVHAPMTSVMRKPENKKVTCFIQDYIKTYMNYKKDSEGYRKK